MDGIPLLKRVSFGHPYYVVMELPMNTSQAHEVVVQSQQGEEQYRVMFGRLGLLFE